MASFYGDLRKQTWLSHAEFAAYGTERTAGREDSSEALAVQNGEPKETPCEDEVRQSLGHWSHAAGPCNGHRSYSLNEQQQQQQQQQQPAQKKHGEHVGASSEQVSARNGVGHKPTVSSSSMSCYGRSVRRAALGGVDGFNRLLESAKTAEQLLSIVDRHLDEFNDFQCTLALHRIARHARLPGAAGVLSHHQWPRLVQRIRRLLQEESSHEPRQLSSVVWSFATLRFRDGEVLQKIGEKCTDSRCVSSQSWDPMSLSLVAQGFAMMHVRNLGLLDSISSAIRRESSSTWQPGDLSRTAWAYAKLVKKDDALFRDVSCKVLSRLQEYTPTLLTQVIWSFATVAPADTCTHLFPRATESMRGAALQDHTPAHLAMVVWSFATVLFRPTELLEEIGDLLPSKADRMNPQDLSMTAWAYATLLAPQRKVFDFLAHLASENVRDFNPQDLSNTAWAFATAGEHNSRLLDAIGDEACNRPHSFNSQHIAMLIWAFTTLKHRHDGVFSFVGRLAEVDRSSWSSAKLLAFSLAVLPRLKAKLGTQEETLRICGAVVDALLERARLGSSEPDDAHTIHDAVYPWLRDSDNASIAGWQEVESICEDQRRRLVMFTRTSVFDSILNMADHTWDVTTVRQ
eukprot:TRINITY_DN17604_c0_g1_i2.p1 TRINITY_DN17604_c0_g1~~TRINITY_DN17604_c0_g1_i2.p1  ORF type:complete len:629 (-),score=88.09 TRINITY_DN17604_c0_g1_i2:36-1922(-)